MTDAPMLSLGGIPAPPHHPGDADPLLISRIPAMPSREDIEKLLAAPPLSYNEARGPWMEEDRRKPVRTFCEVCGYWGRVRCTRCGGKVCALECLQVHGEECFTRYGA
jgi:zinc finger HIT domain-containing protein 1